MIKRIIGITLSLILLIYTLPMLLLEYIAEAKIEANNSDIRPKSIKVSGLTTPVISVKKGVTEGGEKYIMVSLKRYSGTHVEMFFKANRGKYKKIALISNRITKTKRSYKIRYLTDYKNLYIKVRTFEGTSPKKRYSPFSKEVQLTTTPQAAMKKGKVRSVTIKKPNTSVLNLKKGSSYTVQTKVSVTPSSKKNQKVIYKSSNKDVATVTMYGGKIRTKKEGKTVVTVTSAIDKGKKARLEVRVKASGGASEKKTPTSNPMLTTNPTSTMSPIPTTNPTKNPGIEHSPFPKGNGEILSLTQSRMIGDLLISNISLTHDATMSTLLADVKNTGENTICLDDFEISLYDASGNLIITLLGYIGDKIYPNQTRAITASTDRSLQQTEKIQFIVRGYQIVPGPYPSPTPSLEPIIPPYPENNGEILPLNQPRYIGELYISDIMIVKFGDGLHTLYADATNTSDSIIELNGFSILLYDSSGNIIIEMLGYIGESIRPGETIVINSSTDLNFMHVADSQFIVYDYRLSNESTPTPSAIPSQQPEATQIFTQDFENGIWTDTSRLEYNDLGMRSFGGWGLASITNERSHTGSRSLEVTNRSNEHDTVSVRLDGKVNSGDTLRISYWVYMDRDDSNFLTRFKIGDDFFGPEVVKAEYTGHGNEVKANQWNHIEFEKRLDFNNPNDYIQMYFKPTSPNVSFYLDDIDVQRDMTSLSPSEEPMPTPTLTPTPSTEPHIPDYPENNGELLPLIQTRYIGDLYIDNISLRKVENGLCTFCADVTNTSDSILEVGSFTIQFYDSLGNKIIEMLGYIGESINPGDVRTITSSADMDFSHAVKCRFVLYKYIDSS